MKPQQKKFNSPDVVRRLVTENQRLVTHYAKRYQGGAEWGDLIAAGKIGLVKTAERFDSGLGVPFASYAKFWIEKYFWKAVREHTRTMISQSLGHSLNAPVGKDNTYGDIFEDTKTPSPAEALQEKDFREGIKRALSIAKLDDREETIIKLRYPLDGEQPKKQKEIAKEMGLTPRRVRQIEGTAMEKIISALSLGPEFYLIPPEWESNT